MGFNLENGTWEDFPEGDKRIKSGQVMVIRRDSMTKSEAAVIAAEVGLPCAYIEDIGDLSLMQLDQLQALIDKARSHLPPNQKD